MTNRPIEIDPAVMLGKPVIRGTRITVELILRKLSEGATMPDLLDAYPRLAESDVHAALACAADRPAREGTERGPKRSRVDESFAAVPPLVPPISVEEMTAIAADEHAREAADEGLER